MSAQSEAAQPPDAEFTRARWVPRRRVEWAQECRRIMLEHGAVVGTNTYRHRHQARWRAQALMRLLVELRMHERWELREHTERRGDGWIWTVEYRGRRDDN